MIQVTWKGIVILYTPPYIPSSVDVQTLDKNCKRPILKTIFNSIQNSFTNQHIRIEAQLKWKEKKEKKSLLCLVIVSQYSSN